MSLEKTWRWFGDKDEIKLNQLKQFGVEGIVTSLYHIPAGELWPAEEIVNVKNKIEKEGFLWSVAESLPVSEGIKLHNRDYDRLVSNYMKSLQNLGENGIDTVCYNFMPVMDWVRTDLHYVLPGGGEVMYFDYLKYVVLDVFILQRKNAKNDYPEDILKKAETLFVSMSRKYVENFAFEIIVHTQSFIHGNFQEGSIDFKDRFNAMHQNYEDIDKKKLREHLLIFLNDVLPTAEKYNIKLAIHPDDPPFSVFGLPRIVSTKEDIEWIFNHNGSLSNGLTFCSGSLSVRKENNLAEIVKTFSERIFFIHLRNNHVLENGDFYESGHLDGDINLPELVLLLLKEQKRRITVNGHSVRMPVRADHGIRMLDDFKRNSPPGYPLIGRMKGLMEIKGIEAGIGHMMDNQ